MFTVTSSATEQIKMFFKNRDPKPIRLFVNSGG